MTPLGDPHLLDHLHPFTRLEAHLRDMPEVVDLRSHPGHRAVGHDHADASTRNGLWWRCANHTDRIDIAGP